MHLYDRPCITSLVLECDFKHNLTFPQFCRENIPFFMFYSHFLVSPAFSRFSRFFDFSRFLYDYIYFLKYICLLLVNKIRTRGVEY